MTDGTEQGLEVVFGSLLFVLGLMFLVRLYGALLWRP